MIFRCRIYWSVFLQWIFTGCALSDWPSTNSSPIQLLGLFSDSPNASQTTISTVQSRAMFKAAVSLANWYNITIGGHSIGWRSIQTGGDPMRALKNSCLMVSSSNIVGIVGPGLSREANIMAPFAETLGIPLISYGATDPDLSDRNVYPAFLRTIPSDDAAVMAIVQLFQKYNWTSCVLIYQNDAFGSGGARLIADAFYQNSFTVTDEIIFDITKRTVRDDLKNLLLSSSSRIVLVWAQTIYTELLLHSALRNDVLGPQFTWILSSNIRLDGFDVASYNQLIGLLTVKAAVGGAVNAAFNDTLLSAAYELWKQYEPESFPGPDNVDYYALFAFDAAWLLIETLHEFCPTINHASSPCISLVNTSVCFDRQLLNSTFLFDIIHNHAFLGVSGWVEFSSNKTDRINGTYYIAQNVQQPSKNLKYFPVAAWSAENGWFSYALTSAIVWPGSTLTPPKGYAEVSGTVLRIAVVEAEPYTLITNVTNELGQTTTKLVGYMPDLIELLRSQMRFIPNITLVSLNQSYNELIDGLLDDQYDVVVADITITAARREKVAFSSSIFDNSLRVIVRDSPGTNVNLLSYLKPFSWKLWLAFLFTTIYAGFLICIFERSGHEMLQNRSICSVIALSMWYSIGTMLGYGADYDVKTAPGRLLTVGLYILCLVLVAAYTANLASDLTISKTNYLISGIDDIKNGKVASNRIGIRVDSSIEEYYLREISNNAHDFFPLYSGLDMYNDLLNDIIDVSIMDAGVVEYATSSIYCNLTLVGTDFDRSAFGIAFRKKWQYAQQLDVSLLLVRESGALDNLKSKWFQSGRCGASSVVPTAMTIESMAGLFLTFGIISILAVLLFLWRKTFFLKDHLLPLMRSKGLLRKEKLFWVNPTKQSRAKRAPDSQDP